MRSAGTSIKPSEWVDLQGATAFLVLPQAETQTVVALPKTSSLKAVSKEIKVLVATSLAWTETLLVLLARHSS